MDPRIIPDQVGDRRPGMRRVFVSTSRSTNTTSRSRGLICPRFARDFLTLHSEGAGNTGRPMRPIAACAMSVVERTRVSQVTPESPGTPRAMVYGLFRALPGDRAFLPPSPALLSANLTPASGRQDHTSSPSASAPFVKSASASTASRPAAVTIACRPSVGRDGGDIEVIWVFGKPEYFFKRGWTGKIGGAPLIC